MLRLLWRLEIQIIGTSYVNFVNLLLPSENLWGLADVIDIIDLNLGTDRKKLENRLKL